MELIVFPLCLIAALVIIHFVNVYCDWREQADASRSKGKLSQPSAKAEEPIDTDTLGQFLFGSRYTQETQKRTREIDCPHVSPQCPENCEECKYAVIDI